MRILEENPDLTQRELAAQLGMSIGGLNYCMKALIEKGYVKIENFHNSKNKFKYVYVLTPSGIAQKVALTGRFLHRKLEEYEILKKEIVQIKIDSPDTKRTDSQKTWRRWESSLYLAHDLKPSKWFRWFMCWKKISVNGVL